MTVLAIGCHPDDIEFLMSGTLFHLKGEGCELHYMNVANGSCGSTSMSAEKTVSLRASEAKAAADHLGAEQNEIGMRAFGALEHELGPVPLLVELGAAPHASVGTPLPLPFEQLPLLPQPRLEPLAPATETFPRRRLGGNSGAAATSIGRDQDDLSVRGTRNERSKPDELIARRGQISDCQNSGPHDLHQTLKMKSSKGRASRESARIPAPERQVPAILAEEEAPTQFLRPATTRPEWRASKRRQR